MDSKSLKPNHAFYVAHSHVCTVTAAPSPACIFTLTCLNLYSCPAEVEDDGTCGVGLMLARYSRRDDPLRSTVRCLNPPQYDIFRTPPRFVFSLCWLWECLGPDFTGPDSTRIKPYSIVLPNVTAFHNMERMLPGTATLELRKPREV
ncbi:hypothetical protein DUNSADRAFT_17677 [Dunaliella salina]|uniref:Encoded protein n=1 Tax=Dunaliella salina TaxID=3046 RepID=A0ABQ7G1B2_DUNSA|nr:hypothetical protein DUNSADRAFT_17677 [Dunaliella salina]|eukprot:KAF5828391.1 hypothetical protein DUNSADRAFT_17677 [Dunaliella salina]